MGDRHDSFRFHLDVPRGAGRVAGGEGQIPLRLAEAQPTRSAAHARGAGQVHAEHIAARPRGCDILPRPRDLHALLYLFCDGQYWRRGRHIRSDRRHRLGLHETILHQDTNVSRGPGVGLRSGEGRRCAPSGHLLGARRLLHPRHHLPQSAPRHRGLHAHFRDLFLGARQLFLFLWRHLRLPSLHRLHAVRRPVRRVCDDDGRDGDSVFDPHWLLRPRLRLRQDIVHLHRRLRLHLHPRPPQLPSRHCGSWIRQRAGAGARK
mmetsp:Transcript_2987/g.5390  ORF Transcript_2987/g.5390 Transcript_2987/m.5390 type:complete len:262 (-) Transcript_2987:139-924(-)